MELLSLVVSVSSRRTIVSKYITDPVLVSNFSLGDAVSGRIAVVSETNDPTVPTSAVPVTGSTSISLTDGTSITYAAATGIAAQNGNELVFTMVVDTPALRTALLAEIDDFIEAFLEVRATMATGQNKLIAREPVVITKAVSAG